MAMGWGGIAAACAVASFSCVMGSNDAAAAARTKSAGLDSSTRALYVRAWRECYAEYAGYRGPAGSNIALPAFEACFREKTGRYPFQLGRR